MPGPDPGPEPQWSADGQWWWDGDRWTEMWRPPRGLAWDGHSWVQTPDPGPPPPPPPANASAFEPVVRVLAPYPQEPSPRRRRRHSTRKPPAELPQPPAVPAAAPVSPPAPSMSLPPPPTPPAAAPRPAPPPSPNVRRIFNRASWLVAGSLILLMAGISVVELAGMVGPSTNPQTTSGGSQTGARLSPTQLAKALVGKTFTRDVVPPELAQAAPFREVFVPDAIPGLAGVVSASTSDLGGTITIYVFSDPAWAEAFIEQPPLAFGCGVCTSMEDASPVVGAGSKATGYVLYRKTAGGKGWIATTTYVLSGSFVVDGLYYPVNVANPYPTATDLLVPTAYAKAGLQLVSAAANAR